MAFKHMPVEGSKTRTASAAGASYRVGDYDILCFMLKITAKGGTSPTLDSKVQVSYDNSNWADLKDTGGNAVAFAQITANGYYSREVRTGATFVRLYHTIGGTNPTFTMETYIEAKKRGF